MMAERPLRASDWDRAVAANATRSGTPQACSVHTIGIVRLTALPCRLRFMIGSGSSVQ